MQGDVALSNSVSTRARQVVLSGERASDARAASPPAASTSLSTARWSSRSPRTERPRSTASGRRGCGRCGEAKGLADELGGPCSLCQASPGRFRNVPEQSHQACRASTVVHAIGRSCPCSFRRRRPPLHYFRPLEVVVEVRAQLAVIPNVHCVWRQAEREVQVHGDAGVGHLSGRAGGTRSEHRAARLTAPGNPPIHTRLARVGQPLGLGFRGRRLDQVSRSGRRGTPPVAVKWRQGRHALGLALMARSRYFAAFSPYTAPAMMPRARLPGEVAARRRRGHQGAAGERARGHLWGLVLCSFITHPRHGMPRRRRGWWLQGVGRARFAKQDHAAGC